MAMSKPTVDHAEIRGWAAQHGVIPVEVLPHRLDSEPAVLRLMLLHEAHQRPEVRIIDWPEFFLKFDELGLSFVYDDDSDGHSEILQVEGKSPYLSPFQPWNSRPN